MIETQTNNTIEDKIDVELRRVEASEGEKVVNSSTSKTYFVLLRTDFNHHHKSKMTKQQVNTYLNDYLTKTTLESIKSTFSISNA